MSVSARVFLVFGFAAVAWFAPLYVAHASAVLSVEDSITHDGKVRTFRVYVPEADHPLPIVMVLHGLRGSGKSTERHTRFSVLAQSEGFIAVYPDGLWGKWNVRAYNEVAVDDVGFLSALLDRLIATHNVDTARIYVTGASNGGMMTNRLACDIGERLAATAPVVANVPRLVMQHSESAAPIPVLLVNGTDDPFVPFDSNCRGNSIRVTAEQTVDFWVAKNGCGATPAVKLLSDKDPNDGTRVQRRVYPAVSNQAEVIFFEVQGGGHTWPGARIQDPRELFIGATSQDMDATKIIWRFFKQHHRTD